MAGLRAKLLVPVLKFQVKRTMRGAPDERRIRKALAVALFPAPFGTRIARGSLGGVAGEWLQGRERTPNILLYIHGGAFVACSPRTHRAATGGFAKRGFKVFAVDYRLAPEHKFPAALDDIEAAYRGLLASGIRASRIAVAGESAGGNLTLALLLRLKAAGVALPAAVAAWSPSTDLTGSSPSFDRNNDRDAMLDKDTVQIVPELYLPPGHDRNDPFASPLNGDFSDMPPILIHVGSDELLHDDSTRFADKARADGATVALKVFPFVPHAWQLFPILPEATRSLDETAAFLTRHMSD